MKTIELLHDFLPFIILVLIPFVVFMAVKYRFTHGARRSTGV